MENLQSERTAIMVGIFKNELRILNIDKKNNCYSWIIEWSIVKQVDKLQF